MENNGAIEFNKLLNETRSINDLIKKGELLEYKQISTKKLFNICQLLINKNLKNIRKGSISLIDDEILVICDLRTKSQIIKSRIKINNSIECNTIEKAMKIFPKSENYKDITEFKRKHVVLYDIDGTILNEEEIETYQKQIVLHLRKSPKLIKSIYILKGGFNKFNNEFPFICCSTDSDSITSIKSINDISDDLKSKIVASIEYPLLISWGEKYDIYIGNVLQGCHPKILSSLKIKTIFDFTPNKINSGNQKINFVHIGEINNSIDEFIYSNLPLEETIDSIKKLQEKYTKTEDIFPLMIVSTNVTNESVSIAATLVSYLRKWQTTTTLVFLLNQIGLDNNLISLDENEKLFKKLHPSNSQIAQMLRLDYI